MEKEQEKKQQISLDLLPMGNADSSNEERTNKKDLPEGITSRMVYKDIVTIAWPSLVELTLTQLASMVDMMMIGTLGPWAISAIGLTTQPKFLLMTVFIAMNVGTTALVAQSKGGGRKDRAEKVLQQAIVITLITSLIASVVGFQSSEWLIAFMGAQGEAELTGGTQYLQIQMLGFVFMALTTTITAALRGAGNSKAAMKYNLTANVVNVIFNYLLIYGNFGFPKLGVAGASWATIIGQFVGFILAVRCIIGRKNYVSFKVNKNILPDFGIIKSICSIGIPAMLEQLVMRAGLIIYTKTVADLGTIAYATHQVCMNILSFSFMAGQSFAVSATSLVGQSIGKRRRDMAVHYCGRTQRIGMCIAIVIAAVFVLLNDQIVGLYSSEREVIELGAKILILVAIVQPFQVSQFILAGGLRGAGDTRAIAVYTFLTVLILRPGLAILFTKYLNTGLMGAWVALAMDQLVRTTLVVFRYRSGKWQYIKIS